MQFLEMSLRQYSSLLLFGVAIFVIAFFLRTTPPFLSVAIGAILVICAIGIISNWKKTGEDISIKTNLAQITVYISAGLYGIIAGFAIKNAIEITIMGTLNQIIHTLEDTASIKLSQFFIGLGQGTYEISMFFAFLATAIPFYHGAMIFLSKESHQEPEASKAIALHFGCLFIQAIIFLSISLVLQYFLLVILLLILLMIIDSIWIILGQKTKHKPPLGWLSSNLAFTAVLFLIIYLNWDPNDSALFLLFTCLIRTVVDYVGFTKVYFPKNEFQVD